MLYFPVLNRLAYFISEINRNQSGAWKELRKRGYITIKRARMIISAFGWYKHMDSFNVRQKLKVDEMVALAKSKISKFEKGGADVEILHKYSDAENILLCPS